MKIIEITEVTKDRKKIFFTSKEGGSLNVRVNDEFSQIYQNTLEVIPGYSYWVSWLYGWYDTKILFEINGKSEEICLSGTKKDLSDLCFNGLIKKVFFARENSFV